MFSTLQKMLPRFFALLMLPVFGFAQQSRPLQLTEAISLARNHSNQLRVDSLQYQIAGKQASGASASALPELRINSTLERLSNNIEPFSISLPGGSFQLNPQILNQSYNALQMQQLLYGGGKLTNNVKALKKETEASKSDYEKSKLELDQQVTDLWYNLYNAIASQKILESNIEALSKKRNEQDKFRIQGIVLENDVLKIELSVTSLRSNLADVISLAGSLNYTLCLVTGLDPATIIEIPDNYIQPEVAVQPLKEYTDAALAQRPELKSFKLRSEAAAYRVKSAQADYLPTLSFIASYNYDRPNQRIIPNVGAFNYSALAGLSFAWNISSFYTNHHKVSESKLFLAQLTDNALQVRENIQSEVNTAYLNYRNTLDKIKLIQIELQQATENYRVEQNKLNAQTTTSTDFLNANAAFLQAQLNLATAKANAQLAYHKLIKSTGTTAK